MESSSIAPPGGGGRSRKSDDRPLGRCGPGVVAAGVRSHHWGLGFRQCSFRPITRASRDGTVNAFGWPPLLWHALVPSGFRPQVNQTAQKPPSEFLLTASGIQHRVPRRTLSHSSSSPADGPCHGIPSGSQRQRPGPPGPGVPAHRPGTRQPHLPARGLGRPLLATLPLPVCSGGPAFGSLCLPSARGPRRHIPRLSRGPWLLGPSLPPPHAPGRLLPRGEEAGSYFVPDGRLP
jgi:hypothetical protein